MATSSSLPAISNYFNPLNRSLKTFPETQPTLITRFSLASQSLSSAKSHLLHLISDQNRGLATQSDPQKLTQITHAIDSLAITNRDQLTTNTNLSGTWRLLWTTEKEQLFIIKNAGFFGTKAGDVLQVIDVEKRSLNNVITFPPDGVFFVRSNIEIASPQRVNFRYAKTFLDSFPSVKSSVITYLLIVFCCLFECNHHDILEEVKNSSGF